MSEKLTRAAWDLLEELDGRVAVGFREEPTAAAWELSSAGLAYFASGASWTLIITDRGQAVLRAEARNV